MSATIAKPTYITLDNLDDRTEFWHLLHRISPKRRAGYLVRCCRAVADQWGNGPRPTPDLWSEEVPDAERCERGNERLTNIIYGHLLALSANMNLDLVAVALDLERIAKGHVAPLAVANLASARLAAS